ncbi:hypothetical protein ROZALSC1DRAFT_24933, partial [Rozella allomycis CSF55]
TKLSDNVILRMESAGPAISRVYFVNNDNGEIPIPQGFAIRDNSNNVNINPIVGTQSFILAWLDCYTMHFNGEDILSLDNQLADRGGLYDINNQVFSNIKNIVIVIAVDQNQSTLVIFNFIVNSDCKSANMVEFSADSPYTTKASSKLKPIVHIWPNFDGLINCTFSFIISTTINQSAVRLDQKSDDTKPPRENENLITSTPKFHHQLQSITDSPKPEKINIQLVAVASNITNRPLYPYMFLGSALPMLASFPPSILRLSIHHQLQSMPASTKPGDQHPLSIQIGVQSQLADVLPI